jgi:hypothetical protein
MRVKGGAIPSQELRRLRWCPGRRFGSDSLGRIVKPDIENPTRTNFQRHSAQFAA